MAAAYPIDYPFNVDSEGWPEHVYAPSYPFEYYYDNGRNPHEIEPKSKLNNDHYHRPNSNLLPSLPIRRHTPGSTDPNLQQLSSRSRSPIINSRVTTKRNPSKPNPRAVSSLRNHSSASLDPDERPIKPMKDTSVYTSPSPRKKHIPSKKPPSATTEPIPSSTRDQPDSFRLLPSRNQMSNALQRQPIRTNLIPKTPFGIPPKRHRLRPIIVEEYEYPVSYVTPLPKKVVSYQEVSGLTTRELENYEMSKARRIVRIRSPPTKTIVYLP